MDTGVVVAVVEVAATIYDKDEVAVARDEAKPSPHVTVSPADLFTA